MPQPPKAPPKPYAPAPGEVSSEARRLGFDLTKAEAEGLSRYLTLLLKWNRAMSLVGRAGWPDVFRDLAADSLYLAEFLESLGLPGAPLCLDLGAGAGLPGIPLRLVWGVGDYVLVELREKRAIFLRQAVGELQQAGALPGVRVVHGRAEAVGPELARLGLRPRADLVLSRAFMPWPRLLPLAADLLAPGGRLVVLSNEPPPAAAALMAAGGGFVPEASRKYPSGGHGRYFWSLTPDKA
ncbi:MAG: class I SAM-dependent methyltransferase [Humidesulfovibrio sp.]|nr:16S rRNA (guanine(527)-N(7))-methyltransferase RsmG [Desulfovibrio sp.]MDO9082160.1 class I SAM-dependent methyltransferase [Humidesulfovibrio sp.]